MLFTGRKQEYRADQFAIKTGFGSSLLSYLDKIKNMHLIHQKVCWDDYMRLIRQRC